MSVNLVELCCPGCGAKVSMEQSICEYCDSPVIISTFNSVYTMPFPKVNKYIGTYKSVLAEGSDSLQISSSIGMCYLKLKLYDEALSAFEKAIAANFDDPETYFYAAVCILKGRKPFLLQRVEIDKCIQYINAANMIEPRGIFYYFLAYIKYDFFERRYLNTVPNYKSCLAEAHRYGVSEFDTNMLFDTLGTKKPSVL